MIAVLLEEDVRLDPRDFADVFRTALGVTRPESRMILRRARGIVLDRATPEQARTIAEALSAKGVRTRLVPVADLPKLPAPTRVTTLERGDGMLIFPGGAVAWSDILVAVAAPVGVDVYNESLANLRLADLPPMKDIGDAETRDLLRENVILGVQGARRGAAAEETYEDRAPSLIELLEQQYADKLKLYLDLVLADRSRWLRVSMTESSYKTASDGVHMGSAMGFQYLLGDIVKHVPEERRTASVAMLLLPGRKRDLLGYVLPDGEELTRYTMWRAYLSAPAAAAEEPIETIRLEDVPPPADPQMSTAIRREDLPCRDTSSPSPMPSELLGTWELDPSDAVARKEFGHTVMEFRRDGRLKYMIHGEDKDQLILMRFRIERDELVTDQPSAPREERTRFRFEPDGRLVLEHNGVCSHYVRRLAEGEEPAV